MFRPHPAFTRLIAALRESFLSLLPLLVAVHLVTALSLVLGALGSSLPGPAAEAVRALHLSTVLVWPLLLALALTLQLARNLGLDVLISQCLVLLLMLHGVTWVPTPLGGWRLSGWAGMGSVLLPILAVGLLGWIKSRLPRVQATVLDSLSPALSRTLDHLGAFVLTYGVLALLVAPLPLRLESVLAGAFDQLPPLVAMGVSVLAVQGLWWLGLDGGIAWDMLTDNGPWRLMLSPSLSLGHLLHGLVYIGGNGCGLGLTLALWALARDREDRRALRWTTPFTAFNISEPLVYGLPVAGRLSLCLPFMLVPLGVAGGVWWVVVAQAWVPVSGAAGSWLLPLGLGEAIRSPAPGAVLTLAVASVAVATAGWWPFVRRMVRWQAASGLSHQLARALAQPPEPEPMAEARQALRHEHWRAVGTQARQAVGLIEAGQL